MKLNVIQNGKQPIYEQLKLQIKAQITGGELAPGTMLPSIRTLAKELKIGIITAKRVYDDLTAEGFTVSVAGKGVFVSETDRGKLTAAGKSELKKRIAASVEFARANGVDRESFENIVKQVWEENNE